MSPSSLIKNILYFLIFYIPLEEFFLKWLPISDQVFESLHILSDFLILFILIVFLIAKNSFQLRITFSNLSWLLFITISIFSFMASFAFLSDYFAKIWVLLRYIFLYFVILKLSYDYKEFNRFYYVLILGFVIQAAIGVLQSFDVSLINELFLAREGVEKIIITEDTLKGTFKFGVFYAYFLLVSLTILFPHLKNKFLKALFFLSVLFLTLYSGSRIVFLGVIGWFIFMNWERYKYPIILSLIPISGILFFIIDNSRIQEIGSIAGLLTEDFWLASLATGRLGIFNIIPMFFDAGIKEILFGFSYDVAGITSFLYLEYDNLSAILRNNAIIGIEDVYWISFLYYYGLFGLSLFLIFFATLAIKIRRIKNLSIVSYEVKTNLKSMLYLIIFAFFCGFVNQVFFIKTFAFYFWIFLALAIHPIRFKEF